MKEAYGDVGPRHSMPDPGLSAQQLHRLLAEVAQEPPDGEAQFIVIAVGGYLLAWHGLRATTHDVDSVKRLSRPLSTAAAVIARRHDLDDHLLNDSASAFVPATFDESACEILLDHERLLVLGAGFDDVFLMKLFASRTVDYDDLVALWPYCSFPSAEEATRRFYLAYPHETPDPYLASHVAGIASRAKR